MKYLIFNLKSKLNYKDVPLYLKKLDDYLNDCIIAPGYLYLEKFARANLTICSQDLSIYDSGSYTGEVSAQQLKSVGCDYVLIGHYERRKYFNEDSHVLVTKIKQALKWHLKVILCVQINFINPIKSGKITSAPSCSNLSTIKLFPKG